MTGMRTRAAGAGPVMIASPADLNSYPFFAFRIWYGMTLSAWLSVLMRNRFAVSPSRIGFALFGFVTAILHSSLNVIQRLLFARRVRECVLDAPPIFIIGHWRTGTTFLHELLTLDARFTAPSTIECFAPAAFGGLLRRFTFVLPANRPMDNMLVGWDQPQEDEFALMNLGLGSPYEAVVFPNNRQACHPYLNMTALAPDELAAWKAGFLGFLQQVNLRGKREEERPGSAARTIVLKSPTHTARLRILRQMFPDAKFIHIVRDPCEVFSSTLRLWRGLFETQGCQKPEFGECANGAPDLERYVFENMNALYRDFFQEIAEIPAENFCHLRYEDLVRAPEAEMARVYRQLGLGSFGEVHPRLQAHLSGLDGYKPNRHRISERQRAEVSRRWGWYMDRFGYRAVAGMPAAERPLRHTTRELLPA
ncbi:MAG TPA: sulfotransferase [Xanthobacteraceae bacterium]